MSAPDTRILLYGPSAEDLRRQLPNLSTGLCNQLAELHARPRADAAERLAWNLDGARRLLLAYREALMKEGEPSTESAVSGQAECLSGTCSPGAAARAGGEDA